MLNQIPCGIKESVKYRYFSRYCIAVRRSSTVITRAVTIPDFHNLINVAKQTHDNDIIAICTEMVDYCSFLV